LLQTLLFDMSAGVSGDMALGGLFALGFEPEVLNAPLRALGLPASVSAETVSVHGLKAVRARVSCHEAHPPHRGLKDFLGLLDQLEALKENSVPPIVKDTASRVFRHLAQAEAEIHGIAVEKVHFHEIGGLDTFVDVLGVVLGLHALGIERCFATPFPFGCGTIAMEHGVLPEPAPATLLLTRGFSSFRTGWEGEHCTPTGAALVTTLAQPVDPEWTAVLTAVGYGAGSRNPADRANVLRLCTYHETDAGDAAFQVCQIECNLDNATPEQLAYTVERLLEAGSLDAWQEPIVMKKGRAAVKLCALAPWTLRDEVLRVFAAETPAGGIRWFPVRRNVGFKQTLQAETEFGTIEAKEVTFSAWNIRRAHGEYESVRVAARKHGVPLRTVQAAANEALLRSLREKL
jgi:hypothetical protein